MKIAVIGSGISGLASAFYLSKKYKVDLFEQNDHFGGHAFTYDIKNQNETVPVDLGFIVFNELTYPNLINLFKEDTQDKIQIASLMTTIFNENEINNPNVVKVVVDNYDFAMYFSRHAIPYNREKIRHNYLKHVGVYAFRADVLKKISIQENTKLESLEKIEAIRFIEMGYKVKMVMTDKSSIGIDTKDDLKKANQIIKLKQYD